MSSKGSEGSQYDPQIGAAAQATAASAARAQDFSEGFYKEHISPLLDEMVASSKKTQGREDDLYAMNLKQTQEAQDRYDTYGKPAEQNYYDMVKQFSGPEEQERQATSALGDMKTAEAGQEGDFMRSLGARGINPASIGVTSSLADMKTVNAAAEAGAMNRARNTARTMGMTLTADAANYGRGGQSSVLAFSNAAGGNAGASFGAANGALGAANGSAAVPLAGYGTAISGYSSNMAGYSKLGVQDLQNAASADAGFGQLIGTIAGAAIKGSDRRLKRNIVKIGRLPEGIDVYEFNYRWGGARERGVMADEVIHVFPQVVSTNPAGFQLVDYGMLEALCA